LFGAGFGGINWLVARVALQSGVLFSSFVPFWHVDALGCVDVLTALHLLYVLHAVFDDE
jgi:hypothetical protein